MKTSALITKLETLLRLNGDRELRFTVQDHYSKYGEEMNIDLRVGDTTGLPSDYNGFADNGRDLTLQFHLNFADQRKPKIIFRS